MRGRFIVIEGVDGSGKETQSKLLVDHLKKVGEKVLYVDFPQYNGFFGKLVASYLRGEYGQIGATSPFLISIIYALDRTTIREKLQVFLKNGGTVVANRYVPSNIAHQAANIVDSTNQNQFIDWVARLEYEELKLPREDTVIYLNLPWKIGIQKSNEKLMAGTHHNYLKGKADIHEINSEHRQKTGRIYQRLQKNHRHWHEINCIDSSGKQRSPKQIHADILTALKL